MAKSDNGDVNNRLSPSASNDPNNSFMKKVTSRVSGLLPSSLSRWFGEGERTRPVIRRREHDDDHDENSGTSGEEEPSVSVQPPRKRARNMLPAPSLSESFAGIGRYSVTSTPMTSQPGPSGYRPQYNQFDSTVQVHMNGDDRSESGESSGYSSVPLPQHLNNEPSQDKELKRISDINPSQHMSTSDITSTHRLNQSTVPGSEASPEIPVTPVRSLFNAEGLSPNPSRTCMSSRRPSFNASTFGSPGFVDRTFSTSRVINSPFYSGRTMYGGAAAYQRSRLTLQPNKPSIQIRPQPPADSGRSHTNHLSKTAQRILDALESFNHSSVADASKIPPVTNRTLNKSKVPRKELIVPTIPDLLRMKLKERIQNTTVSVRNTATNSKSVLNTEYTLPTEDKTKHSNKIKSKITSVREKSKEDVVEQVALPEVHLPITTLPKFDFSLPPPNVKIPEKKKEDKPVESQFKFSSPISVNGAPKSVISINNFKFSQPLDAKSTTQSTVAFKYVPPTNLIPKKKESQKNNGQNDISIQPAQQLVSGSVMDILGKKGTPKNDLMDKFKPATGSWECSACMVRNTASANRCVACETLKEQPKTEQKIDNSFASQFKMSADKWECSVCMVRNDNKENKCVACTAPKPDTVSVQPPKSYVSATASSWGDKFKPPTDTWECGVCCVRNKSNVTKCVACETAKPGTKSDKPTLIMPPDNNKSGFSDLIKKQNERWECEICLVRNSMDVTVCSSCGSTKPGANVVTTESQFKFGLDKIENKSEFKFGVPSKTTSTSFQFGVPPTSSSSSSNTGFKFGDTTSNNTNFTFGVKATESKTEVSEKKDTESTGFTFGVKPPKNDVIVIDDDSDEKTENKGIVSSSTSVVINKTTSAPAKTATFTFSSPSATTIPFQTPKDSTFGSKTESKPMTFGSTSSAPIMDAKKISFDIPEKEENTETPRLVPVFNFGPPAISSQTTQPVTSSIAVSKTDTLFNFAPKPIEKAENNQVVCSTTEKPASTFPVPQFNFSGGLPFTSKTESTTTTRATPMFSFGSNTPSASKSTFSQVTNKAEVKPFSFGTSETPAKQSTFNFKENSKPLFNFSSNNPQPSSELFSFNSKPETKPAVSFGTVPDVVSTSGVFGAPVVQAPPQNGGFNFGSSTAATPNFKFGSSAPQQNTPIFSFGQSGSTPAAATAPGAFTFGSAPATSNPFSPDVRPNFNFTSGSAPTFTAQGAGGSAAPVRKIRKAVRRVQPR